MKKEQERIERQEILRTIEILSSLLYKESHYNIDGPSAPVSRIGLDKTQETLIRSKIIELVKKIK